MNFVINLTLGVGVLVAALFGAGVQLAIGLWALIGGGYNVINAIRLRVRSAFSLAVLVALTYIGGHLVISWYDPQMFSPLTLIWTLGFLGAIVLCVWMLGGWILDSTVILSAMPDDVFDSLISKLEGIVQGINDDVSGPAWYELIRKRIHWIKQKAPFLLTPLSFTLEFWRRTAKSFGHFLKQMFMVGLLIGLFFAINPPANSWTFFFLFGVGFVGYCIAGIHFNWPLWRNVMILTMLVAMTLGLTAPLWRTLLMPVHRWVFTPATSMYAVTSKEATLIQTGAKASVSGWFYDHSPSAVAGYLFTPVTPQTIPQGTWLLLIDSTPRWNDDLGLYTVKARRANNPTDPYSGFAKTEYSIVSDFVERRSFLDGGSAPALPAFLGVLFSDDDSREGMLNRVVYSVIALFVISAVAGIIGVSRKNATVASSGH